MKKNPLHGFTVDPAAIRHIGRDLQRPESVVAMPDGALWVADGRGGLQRIAPDGTQALIRQRIGGVPAEGSTPNGFVFRAAGDIVVANFGTRRLETMTADGETRVLLDAIDGVPLGQVNYVLQDRQGRLWLTVSTRRAPYLSAFRPDVADGYVAVLDGRGARIVADGFGFANEIRLDAEERWIYLAETTGKRIRRMRVASDGALGAPETFGPASLGPGFPDGIAFDAFGNLWIAQVIAERVLALTPEGELLVLLDAGVPEALAEVERHFATGTLTGAHMAAAKGRVAPLTSSVAFGGADLRDVYLGSLAGTSIARFLSPVAGLPMAHWRA
jgi:sugar lactone lactonase YvrE